MPPAHNSRQTSLRSITDRLIVHSPSSVVVSDIGVNQRQIVVRAPLIVANVGLPVVFFGSHDLLTSFARFLIGDVAVLGASAHQSLVDDGDRVKLEEPHQGIASSAARKVGFPFFRCRTRRSAKSSGHPALTNSATHSRGWRRYFLSASVRCSVNRWILLPCTFLYRLCSAILTHESRS